MREFVPTLLSLSLSGSLVALVLFALKPFFCRYLSRTWHYYIWMLVLARLLLPIGPHNSLMQLAGASIGNPIPLSDASAVEDIRPSAPAQQMEPVEEDAWEQAGSAPLNTEGAPAFRGGGSISLPLSAVELAGTLWIGVATALLVRRLLSYNKLIREIKRSASPCEDAELLRITAALCREMQIHLQPAVYISSLVPSPMLAGAFRPFIVIPAENIPHSGLHFVLRHELVHFKRGDVFYKWAAQIAIFVHWFNPLVYLVRREIGHCCEMACDEAVIRGMKGEYKISYGEAILSAIRPERGKSYTAVSLPMSEDKRQLKERLIAIMEYKKKSRWVFGLTAMLTAVLLCGAAYAGAYTKPQQAAGGGGSTAGIRATAPGNLHTVTVLGETWYLVDTEDQLRGLGNGAYPLDAKYLLNADVSLDKTVNWIPVGTQEAPFTGTFNGNGYEIIDLTISDTSVNVIGMFAYAEDADIYNVTLRAPDIEGAFTPGNSIGPVLALGKNCRSYDNQIIDPVKRDSTPAADNTSAVYTKRTRSLIQDFAPYAAYGIIYNADSDTVTYNGELVKLFAVFKPYTTADATYSFDLLYQSKGADSSLYLEAVRDRGGNVLEIRQLDTRIAEELLLDLEGAHAAGNNSIGKPDSEDFRPYNFDATFNWTNYGISATDKLSKGDLNSTVAGWLGECDKQPGAYMRKTPTADGYTTYIYYNGGGRYPWEIKMEDGVPIIQLHSDSPLATSDGYFLLYFTAPQDYSTVKLFLDSSELELISK